MDLGLSGKRCVVTGASKGIGLAVAEGLVAEGAHVLLVARDEGGLAEAGARVREGAAGEREAAARVRAAAGERDAARELPRVETFAADITAPDAGKRIVGACVERLGGVDVLVNNAGTSATRILEELTEDDWELQWQLNVRGPDRLMRAAAPRMAEQGWGRIVNVASSSGKRPSARNVAYSVTKTAQLALSRAYADAFAARGVLVNAVAPGPTGTGLWLDRGGLADQEAQARGVDRDAVLRATGARVPLGRLGEPREVADVVVFLCSERVSDVVGVALSVDGGAAQLIF